MDKGVLLNHLMKDRTTTVILALLLGGLGIHRFYLGKPLVGLLYLLFCWTFIPIVIGWIDAIAFGVMAEEKFNAKYNQPAQGQVAGITQHCIGCNTALTFTNTPNFGSGFLSDGQRVCRNCFSTIVKTHPSFGLKSKKDFSTTTVLQILQPAKAAVVATTSEAEPFILKTSSDGLSASMSIDLDPEKLIPYIQEQQKKRDQEIASFRYDPSDIQRRGLQLLESASILNSTKSVDTLKGRMEFIESLYDDLVKASHNKRFVSDAQKSIDQYKSMYYDKVLNQVEIALLLKPSHVLLNSYYASCVMNCYRLFHQEQRTQISALKRKDAIEKRLEKLMDVVDEASYELTMKGTDSEHFERYSQELEVIKDGLFKERYGHDR